MARSGTWEIVLQELTLALEPLVNAAQASPPGSGIIRLASEVGYDLEGVLDQAQAEAFASSIATIFTNIESIVRDPSSFGERILELVDQISDLIDELNALDSLLPRGADLGERLYQYLIVTYVERQHLALHNLFVFV